MVEPPKETRDFYLRSLDLLEQAKVPYVVGGGYAMAYYTGIERHTKDLDVFVVPADKERALEALAKGGYRTEFWWPHFLGKAIDGDAFIDVLFNSGNGLCPVDAEWFDHIETGEVLGRPAPMTPVEEMLWMKSFVMERDRYDGPDVAHLIRARGERFDWPRLVRRFTGHERVLLAHLLIFGYIYPSEKALVPGHVIDELQSLVHHERTITDRVCQGTFLSKTQYIPDTRQWGYADARLQPLGPMTMEEILHFETRR